MIHIFTPRSNIPPQCANCTYRRTDKVNFGGRIAIKNTKCKAS